MQKVLRRRFWLTRLALFAGAAWLTGGADGAIADDALIPALPIDHPSRAHAALTSAARSLEDVALARILGVPVALPQAEPPPADTGEPPRTTLELRLIGTLVDEEDPALSIAMVEDARGHTTTYGVGDEIGGARIVAIARQEVTVLNGGRREFFDAVIVTYPEPGGWRSMLGSSRR